MAAAGVSQASSPRLPSPPPFTEVQIGPKSPSVGESFDSETEQLLGASQTAEDGSTRRIRPGTRAIDMAFGPPLVPLSQLDSPFQLQEHLKALYNHFTRPEGSDTIIPISRDVAIQLAEPPDGVDRSLWLYELCRFLTMKANNLIVAFFADSPPCSAQTCPEMRASEWQYLCAVHDPPKACCAIDYCCHTLDWATNILTSPKYFPSRLTLGAEGGGSAQASMRHLTNIFRRLYRIFAHAWFQHREVFWQVEGHDGLYIFFKTVCDMYSLIPEDNYTVPAEAEGLDVQPHPAAAATTAFEHGDGRRVTILRKDNEPFPGPMEPPSISTGATTRRHKGSSSISSGVTTINESAEDDDQPKQQAVAAATAAVAAAAASAAAVGGGQSKPEPAPQAPEEPQQAAEQTSRGSPASQVTVAEVHDDEQGAKPQTESDTEAAAVAEAAPESAAEEQTENTEAEVKANTDEAPTEETSAEKPSAADEPSIETTEAEPAQKA
ncbi:Mob1 family protein [Aspergillus homomorphus CBS 101889]|uniref:Mob1/phocein n=1 Tax=Aspergillus homomorphus (strain CBS 101889) TaxID=1450537 RepID=A0A395IHJ1_ASPHC|nr:Mob1/phocein [Aspergillus homomorphus CBS 101889]RAL17684.1 Mob1/phocein [Aspergillus homomorphus CBS 101889]